MESTNMENFDANYMIEKDVDDIQTELTDAVNQAYYEAENGMTECNDALEELESWYLRMKDALETDLAEFEEMKEKAGRMEYEL